MTTACHSYNYATVNGAEGHKEHRLRENGNVASSNRSTAFCVDSFERRGNNSHTEQEEKNSELAAGF
jgi:hypothetical protein